MCPCFKCHKYFKFLIEKVKAPKKTKKVNPFMTEAGANQWSGFYMIAASVIKGLNASCTSNRNRMVFSNLPTEHLMDVLISKILFHALFVCRHDFV